MTADLLINSVGFPDPAFRTESCGPWTFFVESCYKASICFVVVCTFWESFHPSIAYWDEIDDYLNFTCDLYVHLAVSTSLQGVFHMLHFSLFCASPASLTLSELTGTSGHALLLLFILYPAKHHLSWSYYPLYHQKIIAFLCNILPAEKNVCDLLKNCLAKGASNMCKCRKRKIFGVIHLCFLHQGLFCFKF